MSLISKNLLPRQWNLRDDYQIIIQMLLLKYNSTNSYIYCQVCGSPHDIDLHHRLKKSSVREDVLITDKQGISYYRNSWRNIIPLCHGCHLGVVHNSPQWAKDNDLIATRNTTI